MPHVFILGRLHDAGLDRLRAAGLTWQLLPEGSDAEVVAAAAPANAILLRTNPLPNAAIDAARGLKVVSRHGVGYDNVDLQALNRRRIPLTVVGPVNANAVAEHTLYLMLVLAKRGIAFDRAVRTGRWGERDGFGAVELRGRRLLILGFGRIGRRVAALAQAFGMAVDAYDPLIPPNHIAAAQVLPVPALEPALAEADVVSLHLPLTAQTRGIIDAQALAAMKRTAFLVVTARGGLVDEAALAAALKEGRIAGAGLDVYADEPPPADHPLLKLDNVVLTPHTAALTAECARLMAEVSAQNVVDGLAGRLDRSLVVNPEVLDKG